MSGGLDKEFENLLKGQSNFKLEMEDDAEKELQDLAELKKLTEGILGSESSALTQALQQAEQRVEQSRRPVSANTPSSGIEPLNTAASRRGARRVTSATKPNTAGSDQPPFQRQQTADVLSWAGGQDPAASVTSDFGVIPAAQKTTPRWMAPPELNRAETAAVTTQGTSWMKPVSLNTSIERQPTPEHVPNWMQQDRPIETPKIFQDSQGNFSRQPKRTATVQPQTSEPSWMKPGGQKSPVPFPSLEPSGPQKRSGTPATEDFPAPNLKGSVSTPPFPFAQQNPVQQSKPSVSTPPFPFAQQHPPLPTTTTPPFPSLSAEPPKQTSAQRSMTQGPQSFPKVDNRPFTTNAEMPAIPESPEISVHQFLQQQIKQSESDQQRQLEEAANKLRLQHQDKLKQIEDQFQREVTELKTAYEVKKGVLENAKQNQERILALDQIVNNNTKILTDLNEHFTRTKQYDDQIRLQELQAKQSILEDREKRLLTILQLLEHDKQRLSQRLETLDQDEAQRRTAYSNEYAQVQHDRDALQKYSEDLQKFDRERRETLALEEHKLSLVKSQLEQERNTLDQEVVQFQSEIKLQRDLLQKRTTELQNQIKSEKQTLYTTLSHSEIAKRKTAELEIEISRRQQYIDERHTALETEWEIFRSQKATFEAERNSFDSHAQKVYDISSHLEQQTSIILQSRQELEQEKAVLEQMRHKAFTQLAKSRSKLKKAKEASERLNRNFKTLESYSAPKPQRFQRFDQRDYLTEKQKEIEQLQFSFKKAAAPPMNTFKFDEYYKELSLIQRQHDNIHKFMTTENERLLQSKLDMETRPTGVNISYSINQSGYYDSMLNSSYNIYYQQVNFCNKNGSLARTHVSCPAFQFPKRQVDY